MGAVRQWSLWLRTVDHTGSDFQSAASSRSIAIVETIEREAIARIPSLRRVAFSGQYVELRVEYSTVRGASSRAAEVDEFCESAVVVSGSGESSSEHVISTILFGVGVNPHAVDQPKSQGYVLWMCFVLRVCGPAD